MTMKFSSAAVLALCVSSYEGIYVSAFAPTTSYSTTSNRGTKLSMALDMPDVPSPPPAATSDIPVIESRGGAPVDVRYSDFVKLVNADQVEKVTFSADGTKLLGVDTNGVRLKIESLPNDPDLLSQLTNHKVRKLISIFLPGRRQIVDCGFLAQIVIVSNVSILSLCFRT